MILTTDKGRVDLLKILDFGVAKIISDDSGEKLATTGNVIMGTPAYMSPELLSGIGDRPSCDIYALGCIGFQLLTGQPPFRGRPVDVGHQQMFSPPPRMSDIAQEDVPKEIEDLIAWCLQKKPDDRPGTGADIVLALAGIQRVRRSRQRGGFYTTPRDAVLRPYSANHNDFSREAAIGDTPSDPEHGDLARFEFQLALKRLAESVVDQGCNDTKLLLAMAAVNQADSGVAQSRSEMYEIRRERERAQQMDREREAALRFTLGELNYAHDLGSRSGEETPEMLAAIASLDSQLREVADAAAARHHQIDDREIELVARQSNLEEIRNDAYRRLDEILMGVVPGYVSFDVVSSLLRYLENVRPDRYRGR
jgi:hypothetical protein